MNIDEYRALKAQGLEGGEVELDAQVQHTAIETTQEAVSQESEVQTPPANTAEQASTLETQSRVKFGETEYDLAELIESQRQAQEFIKEQDRLKDELAKAEVAQTYFNKMMENPAYAKTFAENNGIEFVDPKDMKIQQLEKQYNKVLLDKEIENLQIKHKDFDPKVVMPFAVENQIKNLEDAFLLYKTKNEPKVAESIDTTAIKEQIRQELLNELKLSVNTDSIIGSGGTGAITASQATPELTPAELQIAKGLKLTPEEYIKYKTK